MSNLIVSGPYGKELVIPNRVVGAEPQQGPLGVRRAWHRHSALNVWRQVGEGLEPYEIFLNSSPEIITGLLDRARQQGINLDLRAYQVRGSRKRNLHGWSLTQTIGQRLLANGGVPLNPR